MANRLLAATMVLIALMFSLRALAQNAQGPPRIPFPALDPGAPPVDRSQEKHLDGWYKDSPIMPPDPKAAPAPPHDLSGIWEPAAGWLAGVQFMGAQEYPSDGKHFLPFTGAGEEAFKTHKAGFGTNEVAIALNNDPFDMCDPIGFPRIELFNLRAIQIRRFRRVNHDLMGLTLTIIDAKMYAKPWNALEKFPMRLQSDTFDIREMLCSPSEQETFDKEVSKPAIAAPQKK